MRLLFICHSHPDLQAGGTEIFSRDLFRELRRTPEIDGVYLAGTSSRQRAQSPGTAFQVVGNRPDELLMWTGGFDWFFLSQTDLHGVMPQFEAFVRKLQPDVVHFHHLLQLGVEPVPLIRRALPQARIVMTLHDYYPICANDGQMATRSGPLCSQASIDTCRGCFPDRSAADIRLRELHIRGALRGIDHFIAPSEFLRGRFISWGLPPEKVTVIRNGLPAFPTVPERNAANERRDRFAFFGHINRFKGATVALQASARLSRAGVEHALALHGGTAHQTQETLDFFAGCLAAAPDARHVGPYARDGHPRLLMAADWEWCLQYGGKRRLL